MDIDSNLRREIILDNYQNPYKKEKTNDSSYVKVNSNNESCIDNLDFFVKVEDGKLVDICFDGEACAISTSASSILIRSLIGKSIEEVKNILENYKRMINEEEYDKELLGELNVYFGIQPNRKNCALLPSKAINEILRRVSDGEDNQNR